MKIKGMHCLSLNVCFLVFSLVHKSTEELPPSQALECPFGMFDCADGYLCIPEKWRCDRTEDCDDKSDETNCEYPYCPAKNQTCANDMCIGENSICNGILECRDGSDENNCGARGPVALRSRRSRFRRHLASALNSDTQGKVEEFIIVASRSQISGYQFRGHESSMQTEPMVPVVNEDGTFVGLDFDHKNGYVFFSDKFRHFIAQAKVDGSEPIEYLNVRQGRAVEGLAYDWITGILYYTDGLRRAISAFKPNYKDNVIDIYRNDSMMPRAITVLSSKGYLFWSSWARPATIWAADGSGKMAEAIVDRELGQPSALVADASRSRLYWVDALYNRIQSSNFDGRNLQTLASRSSGYLVSPFGMDLYKDKLYYTDLRLKQVRSISLPGKSKDYQTSGFVSSAINHKITKLFNVKVYSKEKQEAQPDHPCVYPANGGCQEFCFSSHFSSAFDGRIRLSRVCGCGNTKKIGLDQQSCVPRSGFWRSYARKYSFGA